MIEPKEFTAPEFAGYVLKQYGHDSIRVMGQVNGWLARGDSVAIYENQEIGTLESGECRLASFGSDLAQLETDTPPDQLPDTLTSVNWRYRLVGVYRGPQVDTPAEDMLGIPADRSPRTVLYTVAMDNYEPIPRKVESGRLVEYDDPSEISGQPLYRRPTGESAIPLGCMFVIDDGNVARPYWGGSHSPGDGSREAFEILMPFPVNPAQKTRADQFGRGREIDFRSWMLGPRKCYHLKITR